jgi:hypothetical protein
MSQAIRIDKIVFSFGLFFSNLQSEITEYSFFGVEFVPIYVFGTKKPSILMTSLMYLSF